MLISQLFTMFTASQLYLHVKKQTTSCTVVNTMCPGQRYNTVTIILQVYYVVAH